MERTTVQTNQRCKLQSLIKNYLHLENFNFFRTQNSFPMHAKYGTGDTPQEMC